MSKKLFSEFDPVSPKAFKQQIQVNLKGADYNDSVIWNSPEGIDVKPFYHREDNTEPIEVPGQPQEWKIGEEIYILNAKVSGNTANKVLNKGTEALFFKTDKPFPVTELLTEIKTESIPIYFNLNFLDVNFYRDILKTAEELNRTVYLNIDSIGNLARYGNWFKSLNEDFNKTSEILQFQTNEPGHIISVDSSTYQNAGASMVQQLAYALAHANEYLNRFQNKLRNQQITFHVAVGSNYFFEIAKIRALRLLYATLADEYNLSGTCHIIARPSLRNKVLYDYNTNMLRTTTECMSAALGGADTIVNLPYDAFYHKTNEFAQRISRNQLLILKEESYMAATTNPAQGSYYIESLTNQLAEKALELFKKIEKSGGFLSQLKSGTIQQKIKEQAQAEQKAFNQNEKVLLGTNKHPNTEDKMKGELELYPFVKTKARKTLIAPIVPSRLAEKIEQERLSHE